MSNHPQYTRILRLPNNSTNFTTREISLADFVYTDVDQNMDTAFVVKNRHGHRGTMSLAKVRHWMSFTLWHDVYQPNLNPCCEIEMTHESLPCFVD